MNGVEFLGMTTTERPEVWEMPITRLIAGGRGQLFGGCGLGAAIEVLEALTGRPTVWATAQFVSGSYPPEVVRVEATLAAEGRNFVQAHVVGSVADRVVFEVQAALGRRSFPDSGVWLRPPVVPGPDESTLVEFGNDQGALTTRLECRSTGEVRDGRAVAADGVSSIWVRFHDLPASSAMGLSVAADLVPFALSATFGRPLFGSSLDNTLRLLGRPHSGAVGEWVLVEMRVDAVVDGVGHVTSNLWSDRLELLAIGTQTCVVSES